MPAVLVFLKKQEAKKDMLYPLFEKGLRILILERLFSLQETSSTLSNCLTTSGCSFDVDSINLTIFLLALCGRMGVLYCIIKMKVRLDAGSQEVANHCSLHAG